MAVTDSTACPDDVATTFDVSGEASFNIFDYYKKWMEFGPIDYELFEIEMLQLFQVA